MGPCGPQKWILVMTTRPIAPGFESFADTASAVIAYDESRGHDFHRALVIQATPTGLNGTTPSEGMFLVEDQNTIGVWEHAVNVGQILRRCRKQPVTNKYGKLKLPTVNETSRANGSRAGGFALDWLYEAEQLPQSSPKFGLMELKAKLLAGALYVSNEMRGDSPAFNAWVEPAAGREIATCIEDAIINGGGTRQPLGILNSDALIVVEPESGQADGTIRAENCSAMAARFWAGSYSSESAAWVCGTEVFQQMENQRKANGAALVEYRNDLPHVMSWPVLVGEYAKPLGEQGDLILADLSQYIVSERESGILGSIHLRWLTDESCLRIKTRVDGAPGWSTPITPKNSSSTQSAFVALAAR
jgi:HK97 family phage major capsid protein